MCGRSERRRGQRAGRVGSSGEKELPSLAERERRQFASPQSQATATSDWIGLMNRGTSSHVELTSERCYRGCLRRPCQHCQWQLQKMRASELPAGAAAVSWAAVRPELRGVPIQSAPALHALQGFLWFKIPASTPIHLRQSPHSHCSALASESQLCSVPAPSQCSPVPLDSTYNVETSGIKSRLSSVGRCRRGVGGRSSSRLATTRLVPVLFCARRFRCAVSEH
jgi:hypothetical protein